MKNRSNILAALSFYGMTRDTTSGAWVPSIHDTPGTIHATIGTDSQAMMNAPYFIEETQHYGQSVCGVNVKVILPNSFKPTEDDACPKCAEQLATGKRQRPSPLRITPPS